MCPIDTAPFFHDPCGHPLKPGLAWLTRNWLGRMKQDRRPCGHSPGEGARVHRFTQLRINKGVSPLFVYPASTELTLCRNRAQVKRQVRTDAGTRRTLTLANVLKSCVRQPQHLTWQMLEHDARLGARGGSNAGADGVKPLENYHVNTMYVPCSRSSTLITKGVTLLFAHTSTENSFLTFESRISKYKS